MCESIIASCKTCGNSFHPSKYKSSKFCSVACYRVAQRAGDYVRGQKQAGLCGHCSAPVFGRSKSIGRNGIECENIYCSVACYRAAEKQTAELRRVECGHCKKSFVRNWQGGKAPKYCSMECRIEHDKPSATKCASCLVEFSAISPRKDGSRWYVRVNGRKTCSKECLSAFYKGDQSRKDKIGAAFRGEKHPNWQGGKSLWNTIHGRGFDWKSQRVLALNRDGNKCVKCGMSAGQCLQAYGRTLDVDHIIPFHNFNSYKKANALSNLQSVCASCHKIEESKRSMVQMLLPMQDGMTRQHKPRKAGEQHPRAIMSYEKAEMAQRMVADGMTYRDVGAFFGVEKSTIGLIIRRKLWVR